MSVTLKKIAELAGVSIGTVDRALNDRKGVNKEVANRIKGIADSAGYQPNKVAKALVMKKRALKIGVIIHTPKHPFFEEVMKGIEEAQKNIMDYGLQVIVKYGKDFDESNQLQLIDELVEEGMNALAIVPIHSERVTEKLKMIQGRGIPVALMVSDENLQCLAYVGCDLERVGKVVCGLIGLVNSGPVNVLYLTPPLGTLGNIKRLEGFKSAIADKYSNINLLEVCEIPNDDIITYQKSKDVLGKYLDVDIVIATVGYNPGLFRAIEDMGIEDQVKIIALDQEPVVIQGLEKGIVIASVLQHPYRQGRKVIEVLSDYLITNVRPKAKKEYIKCDILIRESIF